ncbi:MAG: ABC transporter permease [Firmicutes bacterium]|nr:ABC transporter permease [Bacillota bacterium]
MTGEITTTYIMDVFKRMRRNPLVVISFLVFLLICWLILLADYIAPYPYAYQAHTRVLEPPSRQHLMGTDHLGRDIFSRILHGGRVSLKVGFVSLAGGALGGCLLGVMAGYFGGWLDLVIMRCVEILMAIPRTVLAISMAATLGPGLTNTMLAVAISSVPAFARIARASTLSVKNQVYVEAARALGATHPGIIVRHILPNIMAPIIVQATLGVGTAITLAATLGFLGLGIEPPTPEWGAMLAASRGFMRDHVHMVLFPGLAIMLTVITLNLIGDGLRDALDPKLK